MLNISKSSLLPLDKPLRGIALAASTLVSCFAMTAGAAPALASVPLTRANIEAIVNRVELIPRGRSARVASLRDVMAVGDTLRTAPQSQAQLRFNDGSLARVGQRATFRFVPNTRNFRLSDGTMLLLIPPGRGRSTIQTPSAITGIQGSAVVVRHIKNRNLTVVMALTNNPAGPMTVTTTGCGGPDALPEDLEQVGSELAKQDQGITNPSEALPTSTSGAECLTEHSLQAGQMALIQDNRVQVLEFDLPTFYETSPLLDGLELDNPDADSSLGPDLEQVRAETLEALSRESAFSDATVLNPAVVGLDGEASDLANQPWLLSPIASRPGAPDRIRIFPPAGTLVSVPVNRPSTPAPIPQPIGQTPISNPQPPQAPIDQSPAPDPSPNPRPPVEPPTVEPPTVEPPTVEPPTVEPPPVNPPPVNPPTVEPPTVEPPTVEPPPVGTPPVEPPGGPFEPPTK